MFQLQGASKDKKILLILDGHKTHTKNLELIDLARESGVALLCLPPHCSHRLQPLDVAFMKPLSKYYEDEIRTWMRTNPGKVVTLHQISSLFGKAFIRSATMSTAVSGFRKTGIWPVDKNVFEESDFLPASTTDIPIPADQATETEEQPSEGLRDDTRYTAENNNVNLVEEELMDDPGTSEKLPAQRTVATGSSFKVASPEIMFAIPKVDKKNKRKPSNKRGKTVVLTDSPYKNELVEEMKKQNKNKGSVTKRKLFLTGPTQPKKKKKGKKTAHLSDKPSCSRNPKITSDSEEDDDEQCLYCYDFSEEGWIRCAACGRWAHNSCAGIESEDDEAVHVCVLCESKS